MEDEQNQPKINSEFVEEVEDDQIKEDVISSLPDCLLVEIISRLPETKEAFRTGTLSKRWQHLWRQLPNLIFRFCECLSCSELDWYFCSFVDKTLNQCSRQLNLNKFKLMYSPAFIHQDYSNINDWIRYATNRNVQELELSLRNDFVFDQSFFMNSCFTYLYLGHCNIYPTGAISWTKLTSLAIYHMTIDENLIQNILSGSPLLETLSLESCQGVSWLDVTSKSVKNLILSQGLLPHHICHINAPHILSLTIKGVQYLWQIVFLNLSSLVKVDLEYQQSFYYVLTPEQELVEEEMFKWFLSSFSHVKEIKLNYCCTKIFTRLAAKGFLFPSSIKFQLENMVTFHSYQIY